MLGIQGFIRKPFRENELFSTIGNILGIKYIYDDESEFQSIDKQEELDSLTPEIGRLPNSMLLKMQNMLAIADLDQLVMLIKSLETDFPELTRKLLSLASNYEYDYLHQLLHNKEKKG
jgi:DnaJ-domain-containing protein 1